MHLYLKIHSGPRKGEEFEIKPGLSIGRYNTGIVLDDKRVSAVHARVEMSKAGQPVLVDQGSSNGTKISGKKHGRILLRSGLQIQIGDTTFDVIDRQPAAALDSGSLTASRRNDSSLTPSGAVFEFAMTSPEHSLAPAAPPFSDDETPPPEPVAEARPPAAEEDSRPRASVLPAPTASTDDLADIAAKPLANRPTSPREGWAGVLEEFAVKAAAGLTDEPHPLSCFFPALELRFLSGPQSPHSYVLGYGPREVGAKSLDLPLIDTNAPGIAFKISPTPKGALFETAASSLVRINDQQLAAKMLRPGDVISVGETRIEVKTIA
jgi:hypothetical protein